MYVSQIDLTPKYAPLLYGVTNSIANTAGVISPALYGHILGNAAHATTDGSESSAACCMVGHEAERRGASAVARNCTK